MQAIFIQYNPMIFGKIKPTKEKRQKKTKKKTKTGKRERNLHLAPSEVHYFVN